MHQYLIEWFRNILINPDTKVVEKHWETAGKYATGLSRGSLIRMLRLFLFSKPDAGLIKQFTDELLAIDPEFPVANNAEQLRLMAGVVMVASFGNNSTGANAFALGLRAASFPGRSLVPVQPAILNESEDYLQAASERQRPSDFRELGPDEADAVPILSRQVRRLAEEIGFLWWALGGHSSSLRRPTSDISPESYALVAAWEAAAHTQILPPPSSAGALLARALSPCKQSKPKSKAKLSDVLAATDENWRRKVLGTIHFSDCVDLVPVTTSIAKYQEFRDLAAATRVLPQLCPGLKTSASVSPVELAVHFYMELMFLKALSAFTTA